MSSPTRTAKRAAHRKWDERKHPRDDRGRFAHKGQQGFKWINRMLEQSGMQMWQSPIELGKPGQRETLIDTPAAPRVGHPAAADRVRVVARQFAAAPGGGVDARIARSAGEKLERVSNDLKSGRITPQQAANRVHGIRASVVWSPKPGSNPLGRLASDLEGGPAPVRRPEPGQTVNRYRTRAEAVMALRGMDQLGDLAAPSMTRLEYGAEFRKLAKQTMGPSADKYTDAQRAATVRSLLDLQENHGGGNHPDAAALRGMLDLYAGPGAAKERANERAAAGAVQQPTPRMVVEPPRRLEWGERTTPTPKPATSRVTPVDTPRASRKTEGMSPTASPKAPTALPAGQQRVLDLIQSGEGYKITSKIRQGRDRYTLRHPGGSEEGVTPEVTALLKRGELVYSYQNGYITKDQEERRAAKAAEQYAAQQASQRAARLAPRTFATPQDESNAVSEAMQGLRQRRPADGSIIDLGTATREEVTALRLHDQGRHDTPYQKSVRLHQLRSTGEVMPYGRVVENGKLVDNPAFAAADAKRPKTWIEKGWAQQEKDRADALAAAQKVYDAQLGKTAGKSRAWLTKQAKAAGVEVPRGTSDDQIRDALARHGVQAANLERLAGSMGGNSEVSAHLQTKLAQDFASANKAPDYVPALAEKVIGARTYGMGATKTGTVHPDAVSAARSIVAREGLDIRREAGQQRIATLLNLPEVPKDAPKEQVNANELGLGDWVSTGAWRNRVASVIENPDGTVTVHTVGVTSETLHVPGDQKVTAWLAPRRGLGGGMQKSRRLRRQMEDDRQERIRTAFATAETAPPVWQKPADGRPRVADALDMTPRDKGYEWRTSVTPDLTTKDSPNVMISDVGSFDGVQARGELYNPTGPGQPYRARIFDYADGRTIATFESMDLKEAFAWADRVHDTRRGKAMPRREGVTAEYTVKAVKPAKGTGIMGTTYEVHETLSTGETRKVSGHYQGADAHAKAASANALERKRLGIAEPAPEPPPAPPVRSTRKAAKPAAPPKPIPSGRVQQKAKRGDLVLVQRTTRDYVQGKGTQERTEYDFGKVVSVDREGKVKTYTDTFGGTTTLEKGATTRVSPAEKVNVDAVMEAARQHTYPNSTTPMPFASVEDAVKIARPHVGDQTAKLAAERAATPKGRNPEKLRPGDRVLYSYPNAPGQSVVAEVLGTPEVIEPGGGVRVVKVRARNTETGKEGIISFRGKETAKVFPAAAPAVETPAPVTPEAVTPEAVKLARQELSDSIGSRVRRDTQLAEISDKVSAETRADLTQKLDLVFDGDQIANRAGELAGQVARHDAIEEDRRKALEDLRYIANDHGADPARREAAGKLADQVGAMATPNVEEQRRELLKLQADAGSLVAAKERRDKRNAEQATTATSIRQQAAEAARAELAQAFGTPDFQKGMSLEESRLVDDFITNRSVEALRKHQAEVEKTQAADMNDVMAVMGTPQGKEAARRERDQAMASLRMNSDQAQSYGYKADAARGSLERAAARSRQRIEDQARRDAERAASPEALDKADLQKMGGRLKAKIGPGGQHELLNEDEAAKVDSRALKKANAIPGDAKIKTMPPRQREVAEDAIRAIRWAAIVRTRAANNSRQEAAAREVLAEGGLRDNSRKLLEDAIAKFEAGGNVGLANAESVREAERNRDVKLAVWRAVNASPLGERMPAPASLLAGLSPNEREQVVYLAEFVGIEAARRLAAELRGQ